MDVVVIPSERTRVWRLRDRLGRELGEIGCGSQDRFLIYPSPDSGLASVALRPFASLDEAMTEIACHMKGACSQAGPVAGGRSAYRVA